MTSSGGYSSSSMEYEVLKVREAETFITDNYYVLTRLPYGLHDAKEQHNYIYNVG